MKEFWIFKKDGSSYIEYGEDVGDIYISKDSTVEEYIKDNNKKRFLSKEEENYYEKFFDEVIEEKSQKNKYIKIDILLENQKILSDWERKFVFGFKKSLNNNYNISKRQEEILDNIYLKKFSNIA